VRVHKVFIVVFLLFSMVLVTACKENGLLIIDGPVDGDIYYENLLSNSTSGGSTGTGILYEYLDDPDSGNRTYYEIIGDDKV
jgi:hypothetical protein